MRFTLRDIFQTSNFYPGSIWIKRVIRILIILAVGLNLFLNNLQNHILQLIDEQACEIGVISDRIDAEQLRLERIQSGSWKEWSVDWLAYFIDSPKSNEINQFIDFSQKTLDSYELINERLGQIDASTELAMKVLYWTSRFMWIPIAFSLIWLLIDLQKGDAKLFVMTALILSIPFNIISYEMLSESLALLVERALNQTP